MKDIRFDTQDIFYETHNGYCERGYNMKHYGTDV